MDTLKDGVVINREIFHSRYEEVNAVIAMFMLITMIVLVI